MAWSSFGKLHETYGKEEMLCIDMSYVDTFLITNSVWYETTRYQHKNTQFSKIRGISRDLVSLVDAVDDHTPLKTSFIIFLLSYAMDAQY